MSAPRIESNVNRMITDDPKEDNPTLYVCRCGCDMFTKLDPIAGRELYLCQGCRAKYLIFISIVPWNL